VHGVSWKGIMACPPIPFNPIICHSPLHFCLCTNFMFVYLLIFPYNSYLFSSIIYEHDHRNSHKQLQFSCRYIACTSWVTGVECLFLRSAGNIMEIKQACSISALTGCHSSVTVLMANNNPN